MQAHDRPPNSGTRSRYWVFTLNNYTEADPDRISGLVSDGVASYVVIGKEVGANGTRHLQGYIEFSQRLRFSRVRNLLGRCHIESRNGTAQQAGTVFF